MPKSEASLKTRSHTSNSSSASSTGSAAARARARAEAAKARLLYAEEEMKLKLEKAKLEASMDLLNAKKETAAAVAEAEALEAAVENEMEVHHSSLSADSALLEAQTRIEQYVTEQAKERESELHDAGVLPKTEPSHTYSYSPSQLKPEAKPFLPNQAHASSHLTTQRTHTYKDEGLQRHRGVMFEKPCDTPVQLSGHRHENIHHVPLRVNTPSVSNNSNDNMSDFVRYFARRELVATGLLQFNDKPQNYRAWRRSFQNATQDLNLTPSEEMDLLLRWLGKESSEHVEQIRAIHINHPQTGLDMIWDRLERTYGSAEAIEDALFKRVDAFPKIANRDYSKLTKLSDLLMELESARAEGDLPGLSFLDTARGINPIVQKLPFKMQEKWATIGSLYKQEYNVSFPPFHYFVEFVSQQAQIKNDPSFNFMSHSEVLSRNEKPAWRPNKLREVSVHKTEIFPKHNLDPSESSKKSSDWDKVCPIHKKPHPLYKCRAFREKALEDRKLFLKENKVCFKCCASSSHLAKNCNFDVRCYECKSDKHHTVLHPGPAPWIKSTATSPEHGGEQDIQDPQADNEDIPELEVDNKCTEICGGEVMGRSCSKISLVKVYQDGHKDTAIKMYVIMDEQSNRSLVRSKFFEIFNDQSPSAPYSLKTCAGVKETAGRRASGYIIESLDGTVNIPLPSLIECDDIPNNRNEIPTPNMALHHPHLKSIAHLIPDIDSQAEIMLLLGRDIIRVHKARKQINGPHNLPYAQKLDLGWVIVGNVCLGSVHKPPTVGTFYTITAERPRPTLFDPCPNVFHVKEKYSNVQAINLQTQTGNQSTCDVDHLGCGVFKQTKDDNKVAFSIQDAIFMEIMEKGLKKGADNGWIAPLPFKCPRQRLPNNRSQALNRLTSLKNNFKKKPEMKDHFISFMEKMLKKGHAELAPPLSDSEECWYLPIFGVYHPRKPKQIRVVFDSSAQFNGMSLNDVLLTGPDLNNKLFGVLIRFRKEAVAFTADIEQMFYFFFCSRRL
ncbi:uncharacterized protein LOC130918450 isoform X1 [Corythoichthys intestinalis]|uniref:uncharacterized protein LOC130918450 isoform X1 n=1 Tax=Corythoichthys intestinalis TaxID=161448 RepID=UPI0025A54AC8|nr:uncharacterized protein LOC130918450 isoform X1 [Corythoichthys intestinalis]